MKLPTGNLKSGQFDKPLQKILLKIQRSFLPAIMNFSLFKVNERKFPIKVLTKNDAAEMELNSIILSSQMERLEVKDRLISTFGGISSKPM
jgi:hypothetical protein